MSDIYRSPETAPETSYGTDLREEMKRDWVHDMVAELRDDDIEAYEDFWIGLIDTDERRTA
jgi:hypothetical protein